MKKIILFLVVLLGAATLSAQLPDNNKFWDKTKSDIRYDKRLYDYVIEKTGSTYSATTSLTGKANYSGTDLAAVFNQAIAALTSGGNIWVKSSVVGEVTTSIGSTNTNLNNIAIYFSKGSKLTAAANLMNPSSTLYNSSVFFIENVDNWIIDGITVDGNASNQTFKSAVDQSAVFVNRCNNVTIRNANISNMRIFGVTIFENSFSCGVEDSYITTCGWNCITLGNHNTCANLFAINNECSHAGDVGISVIGTYCKVLDNYIHDIDGSSGDVNGRWGLAIEYANASNYNIIRGNWVVNTKTSLDVAVNCLYNVIESNYFLNANTTAYLGSLRMAGGNNIIRNNYIYTTDGQTPGINIEGSTNIVQGNSIEAYSTINISGGNYNLVSGNWLKGSTRAMLIASNSTYNRIIDNDLDASAAGFDDTGTGNIYANNVAHTGNFGAFRKAVTATADGLTTGALLTAYQDIVVTSSSANNIVCLPPASALTVGAVIRGQVGANGFELRVAAAQASSAYLNNVTTNVEAAIPANTTFEITCTDATHWILKAWTALGAPVAAIVPDAN